MKVTRERVRSNLSTFITSGMLLACSGGEKAPPLRDFGLGAELTYPGCEHVEFKSCFVDDAQCQQRVYDALTCVSGAESGVAPPVELVTRAELADILINEGGASPSLSAETARALAQLGLLDPQLAVDDDVEVDVGGIAGVYLPNSDRILLVQLEVEEKWPVIAVIVLVHEYRHYQQAREVDLQALEGEGQTYDQLMATISTIEGEASVYERVVGGVFTGIGHERQVSEVTLRASTNDANDFAASAGSPYTFARLLFPYTYGAAYAARQWRAGGSKELSSVLKDPARSTRQLMTPEDPFDPESVVDVPLPEIPDGWTMINADSLGAWLLFGVLAYAADDVDSAWPLSLAWRGDSFGAYQRTDDIVGLWTIAFDTAAAAANAAQLLDGLFTGDSTLEAGANGATLTVLGARSALVAEEWRETLP